MRNNLHKFPCWHIKVKHETTNQLDCVIGRTRVPTRYIRWLTKMKSQFKYIQFLFYSILVTTDLDFFLVRCLLQIVMLYAKQLKVDKADKWICSYSAIVDSLLHHFSGKQMYNNPCGPSDCHYCMQNWVNLTLSVYSLTDSSCLILYAGLRST